MLGTRLQITPYERQHRSALLDLTFYSQWTHKHLDWYSTGQWLDDERGYVFLAWHGGELVGYIGLSLPIKGCSWIRLLGIRDGRMPGQIVGELWERAESQGASLGISNVAVLMVTNWLPTYFRRLGFSTTDDIITMSHIGNRLPAAPNSSARVRPAETDDIARIAEIDRLSFSPHWRMSFSDFQQALRISPVATVAVWRSRVVGYQLSTIHNEGGHLARLAVDPSHQRQGIASLLMHRLLDDLQRNRVESITVNTQLSNVPSQHLYQRYGYFRNGYDLELWNKQIA